MLSSRSSKKPKGSAPVLADSWQFEAIGTHWWIGVYETVPKAILASARKAVIERIQLFDITYSRFRDDSLIAQIAQNPGTHQFPPDSEQLFALYYKLYAATEGLVTPLIGQTLVDAGYDAQYSLQPGTLRTPPAWDTVMHYKQSVLTTKQPLILDFGAAGKGYLADIVSEVLQDQGIEQFCIDASGDIVCKGIPEPLHIGMEHPDDPSQVIGVVELQRGALCGSAGNRRSWAQFNHIINPEKLSSPQNIKAAWVTADTALLADGLATAVFFTDPQKLRSLFSFEYALLYADGQLQYSSTFPAEIFTR